MKPFVAIILFCISIAYADDTNITSKVFEKRDKDGKVKFRIETVYRGKAKIMMVWNRPNKDGVMRVASRNYLVGGKLVMTEIYENYDEKFETITAYDPSTNDLEIFFRQPDGSVKPADTKVVEASKKQNRVFAEFFDTAFQKEMSDQELRDSILKTQKKIQDAEKEKKDDKK